MVIDDTAMRAAIRAAAYAVQAADPWTPEQHAADIARYAIDYKRRQDIYFATGVYTAPPPPPPELAAASAAGRVAFAASLAQTPAQALDAAVTASITAAPAPRSSPTTAAQRGLGVSLEGAKTFMKGNPIALIALAITAFLLMRR